MTPQIDYGYLPEHMQEGMKLYIENGVKPGRFLRAVLENDLMGAFGKADPINQERIRDFCSFLYNNAPRGCYGSPEIVSAWINRFEGQEV